MTVISDADRRISIREEFAGSPDESFHTESTVAIATGLSQAKLAIDRMAGRGIPFFKLDHAVRYLKGDVMAFMARARVDTKK